MKKLIYYVGLAIIAVWLFILHSTFVFAIMPLFLAEEFFSDLFVIASGYDLKIYFPYIFGAVFAFAIAATMRLLRRHDRNFWRFAFTVAFLEIIGFTLLCMPSHEDLWIIFSAIYYGLYIGVVIIFYYYVKPNESENATVQRKSKTATASANATAKKGANDDAVMRMYEIDKMDPKDIASVLKVHTSTVYRIIKRHEESE